MPPIPDNTRYVCLAVRTSMRSAEVSSAVALGESLVLSADPPVGLPAHWREWLGTLEEGRLKRADLFITALAPLQSGKGQTDDRVLNRRVTDFLTALMLATPGFKATYVRLLGGFSRDGEVRLSDTEVYEQVRCTPGTPTEAAIHQRHITQARAVADGLTTLSPLVNTSEIGQYARLSRALNAFRFCVESKPLGHRLHQSVRVLEALLAPGKGETGKVLGARAGRLLGEDSSFAELLTTLYTLRSKVEHLYGPVAAARIAWPDIPRDDVVEAYIRFAAAAHVAEDLARAMLTRILSSPELWPHFSSEATMREFWTSEAADLWGMPLGPRVRATMNAFDRDAVTRMLEPKARRRRAADPPTTSTGD